MNFLEKLQALEEPEKRWWIVLISGFSMVIVVYLWLGYFSAFVVAPSGAAAQTASAESSAGLSLVDGLRSGVAVVYRGFTDKVAALRAILKTPRDYTITPQE